MLFGKKKKGKKKEELILICLIKRIDMLLSAYLHFDYFGIYFLFSGMHFSFLFELMTLWCCWWGEKMASNFMFESLMIPSSWFYLVFPLKRNIYIEILLGKLDKFACFGLIVDWLSQVLSITVKNSHCLLHPSFQTV